MTVEPPWEACKICGGNHWTKDHDLPGPDNLPPNLKPGGLVFQTYRGDGSLWFEHRLETKERPVELDYPDEPLAPGELVTLRVYDGDSGAAVFFLRARGPLDPLEFRG